MALRTIREIGDPILEKECKPLKAVTDRTVDLINDMFETMYAANGVGLAAPQVGILRQLFVIDIGDGQRYICINPTVTAFSGLHSFSRIGSPISRMVLNAIILS